MATSIIAQATEYRLSEEDRLKVLAMNPEYTRRQNRAALIERQRAAFIEIYGDPFGLPEKTTHEH